MGEQERLRRLLINYLGQVKLKIMAIYKPPMNVVTRDHKQKTVFLAGSIESDTPCQDWQKELSKKFDDCGWTVLNPRRDNWDPTWEQKFTNPNFYQQVNWELDGLELVDMIVMYFDPGTLAPISLLEFGLHAKSGKMRVICPEGFWRKGNVEITCAKYNVPLYENFEVFFLDLKL